jgi:hypothetical protein
VIPRAARGLVVVHEDRLEAELTQVSAETVGTLVRAGAQDENLDRRASGERSTTRREVVRFFEGSTEGVVGLSVDGWDGTRSVVSGRRLRYYWTDALVSLGSPGKEGRIEVDVAGDDDLGELGDPHAVGVGDARAATQVDADCAVRVEIRLGVFMTRSDGEGSAPERLDRQELRFGALQEFE